MEEIWIPIKGFESTHQVSNHGRVKSTFKNKDRILTGGTSGRKGGKYIQMILCSKGGIKKRAKVHKLVAEHFLENTDNKPCINHIDGNKFNNRLDNLEYCSVRENNIHAWYNGLQKGAVMVLHTETGIYYEVMKEAAIAYNISYTNLARYMNGHRTNKSALIAV